ncbi:hypothetical protein HEB94_003787 [Actinopolymorpha pittospori]|uniref:Uncharacterized protein n=1 Tax=Actinopolymorpha pittospori TaxID=648752 RepID=A0A927MUM7_9ACTN|nr:hypothetical protein [Actinopolymorpha pittospori]
MQRIGSGHDWKASGCDRIRTKVVYCKDGRRGWLGNKPEPPVGASHKA